MTKKMVGSHCRQSRRSRAQCQQTFPIRGNEKHDQVGHEVNKSRAQVPAEHQHQHMRSGKAAGNADFTKVLRLGQHTRHAEHKGDLHKLRSLEGKAADLYAHLRPVAGGTDQKDSEKH